MQALYDYVFFDCDSTLTKVEGVDELARMKGGHALVTDLTRRAMEGELELADVYRLRLRTIIPTRRELAALRRIYREEAVEDAREVVQALSYLKVQLHVVSGGLYQAVQDFSLWLGIPRDHVHAVVEDFDELAGRWWAYWEYADGHNPEEAVTDVKETPLIKTSGKGEIIARIAPKGSWSMLVGDGASDLAAKDKVRLFVGFGGVVYRPAIEDRSDVYIRCSSLAPVLPLAAGEPGIRMLQASPCRETLEKGLHLLRGSAVTFKVEARRKSLIRLAERLALL